MYTVTELCAEISTRSVKVIDHYTEWFHQRKVDSLAKTKAELVELESALDKLNARVVYARLVLEWDMQKHGVTAEDTE